MKKVLDLIQDCCAPLLQGSLEQNDADQLAAAFRVMGDPARLRLISMIGTQPNGEACVCDLVEPLGLAQPTVSHHLKVLHSAGLLTREKRGTWVYYRVVPERLETLRGALATDGRTASASVDASA